VVVSGEDGRVLGLISDRDLLQRASPDTRPWLLRVLTGQRGTRRTGEPAKKFAGPHGLLTASELMAPALFTVRPEDSLTHAIRLMLQHQVKRLIVVDNAGGFLGLVDRREILRSLFADTGERAES
jgi:CBS domain-containing protein